MKGLVQGQPDGGVRLARTHPPQSRPTALEMQQGTGPTPRAAGLMWPCPLQRERTLVRLVCTRTLRDQHTNGTMVGAQQVFTEQVSDSGLSTQRALGLRDFEGTEGQRFSPGEPRILLLRHGSHGSIPGQRDGVGGTSRKGQKSAAGLTENKWDLPVTKGLQSRPCPIITKHF